MHLKENKKYKNAEVVIKTFIPGLIEMLGEQNISWILVNSTLQKHIENVRAQLIQTGKRVKREATFHSIIVGKILGK